jgi:hypothetical protein
VNVRYCRDECVPRRLVNIRAITSMKSRRLAASTTPTVINRLERTRAEPPFGAGVGLNADHGTGHPDLGI